MSFSTGKGRGPAISESDLPNTPHFAASFVAKMGAGGVGEGSRWPSSSLEEVDMSGERPQRDRKQ